MNLLNQLRVELQVTCIKANLIPCWHLLALLLRFAQYCSIYLKPLQGDFGDLLKNFSFASSFYSMIYGFIGEKVKIILYLLNQICSFSVVFNQQPIITNHDERKRNRNHHKCSA